MELVDIVQNVVDILENVVDIIKDSPIYLKKWSIYLYFPQYVKGVALKVVHIFIKTYPEHKKSMQNQNLHGFFSIILPFRRYI